MRHAIVAVPHTEDGLKDRTARAVTAQCADPRFCLTTKRSPFSYADVMRDLWRRPGDLIIVEQDVIPPSGAFDRFIHCPAPWCTHPHWTGEHYQHDSLGLAKFSADLRRRLPQLADQVCAAPDSRYWVRRGWTHIPRDCSPATLNRDGVRACLRPDVPVYMWPPDIAMRPTTHDWMAIDTDLSYALRSYGIVPHVHMGPTVHLHDYDLYPTSARLPWHQREYDASEWPD